MHRLAAASFLLALTPSLALAAPGASRARQGHPELGLSVFAAVPSDEVDDVVDTSLGFRLGAALWLSESFALHVAGRYIAVNTESDLVDVSYFDLAVGATALGELGSGADAYLQGELIGARVEVDAGPFSIEDEDPGFAFRGGIRAPVAASLAVDVFFGLSQTFASDDDSSDSRWVDVGAGLVFLL